GLVGWHRARTFERFEDVSAFGILELVVGLVAELLAGTTGSVRITAAVVAARAVLVVGRPDLLVVVGRDRAGRPRVSGDGDLGVGEEAVGQAPARRDRVVVRCEGVAVQRPRVVGVVLRGVHVAEVLIERLVLGD